MENHIFYLSAVWIFFIGLFGAIRSKHFIHLCVCLVIIQSSTYILLLGIGFRLGAPAPVFVNIPAYTKTVDPVVQALMLTDIVVESTVIALLLSLVVQIHNRTKNLNPNLLTLMKG